MAKRRADHAKLTGEVAALHQEKDGPTPAIASVRDAGLAEVREVADAAVTEVQRAAGQFERLSQQAAELGRHLRLARALASSDPATWRTVAPET